jgi:hypothetical protein
LQSRTFPCCPRYLSLPRTAKTQKGVLFFFLTPQPALTLSTSKLLKIDEDRRKRHKIDVLCVYIYMHIVHHIHIYSLIQFYTYTIARTYMHVQNHVSILVFFTQTT